jgi:hypothetical protein
MHLKPLMFLVGICSCTCTLSPSAYARIPEPEADSTTETNPDREQLQRSFAFAAQVQLSLGEAVGRINEREVPLRHQQIIYEILRQTSESAIHQMRGEHENKVYYKESGEEVVFDKDGNRVSNGYNDGTFNYAFYKEEPLLHFTMDISPWIMMGISENDPTEVKERIYAYMGDLENGITRAHKAAPFNPLPESHQWEKLGQLQALGVFVKAIEAGSAEELYDLFDQDEEISVEQIIRVLTKLNRGFDLVYGVKVEEQDTP